MGLLSNLLMAPLAPLKGTVWVAEQIHEEAQRQHYDPGAIRRALEQVSEARAAGEISEDAAAELENDLVARLIESRQLPR